MISRPLVSAALLLIVTVLVVGCMPASYRIDSGVHPENVDKNVRFRTTYYFRVIGSCVASGSPQVNLPEFGGLYRFRMTGKANALTNKVRFESGILPARSIDPFGISLKYDKDPDSLSFRDVALEDKARIAKDFLTVAERLKTLQTQMTPAAGQNAPPPLDSAITAAFNKAIAAVISQTEALIKAERDAPPTANFDQVIRAHQALLDIYKEHPITVDELKKMTEDARKHLDAALNNLVDQVTKLAQGRACASNDRGFMILGPEGWRQFNPDERLILAMYSSGRPLISTLNELSARATNVDVDSPDTALVFSKEQAGINKSRSELDEFDPDDPKAGPGAIGKAIAALSVTQGK